MTANPRRSSSTSSPSTWSSITTKDGTLVVDGEPIPADEYVTVKVRLLASLMDASAYSTAKSIEAQLAERWPNLVAQMRSQVASEKALPPITVQAVFSGPLEIASMPDRVTRRKVVRDQHGRISETVEVETDEGAA